MSQRWVIVLLLLVTLGINNNVQAADNNQLPPTIIRALQEFKEISDDSGIIGLQKVVPHCYTEARTSKQKQDAEKCIMLDLLTFFSNQHSVEMGMDFKLPGLTYEDTDKRMRSILTESGMTDKAEQDKYLNAMAATAKSLINE